MTHGCDRSIARAFSPQAGGGMKPGAFHPSEQRPLAGDPGLPQARIERAFSPRGLRAAAIVPRTDPTPIYHCPGILWAIQHEEAFTWTYPTGGRRSMRWMNRLWR
jgi:hypothetical protein